MNFVLIFLIKKDIRCNTIITFIDINQIKRYDQKNLSNNF